MGYYIKNVGNIIENVLPSVGINVIFEIRMKSMLDSEFLEVRNPVGTRYFSALNLDYRVVINGILSIEICNKKICSFAIKNFEIVCQ